MKHFKAVLLILCALALCVIAAFTLYVAMRALALRDTLPAIESAFGSAVIGLLMFVLGMRLLRRGRLLLREAPSDETAE